MNITERRAVIVQLRNQGLTISLRTGLAVSTVYNYIASAAYDIITERIIIGKNGRKYKSRSKGKKGYLHRVYSN